VGAKLRVLNWWYAMKPTFQFSLPFLAFFVVILDASATQDQAAFLMRQAERLRAAGNLSEAEPLYHDVIEILEREHGSDYIDIVQPLYGLAFLYEAQDDFEASEQLKRRALAIEERHYGPDHPEVATTLSNLGLTLINLKNYRESEALFQRALQILEADTGAAAREGYDVTLNNLGELLREQRRFEKAESTYLEALVEKEAAFGPNDPAVATTLNNLGLVYHELGRFAEAEAYYARALDIVNEVYGPDHPIARQIADNLEEILSNAGEFGEELSPRARTSAPDHESNPGQSPQFGVGTHVLVFGSVAALGIVVSVVILSGGRVTKKDGLSE